MSLANLTFRAWYEAQGKDWETLDRIATGEWMDYLVWYRRVTGARIENRVSVDRVTPDADGVELALDGTTHLRARHVVLATGREGQAALRVPAPFRPFIGDLVRHTSDEIDFVALRGARVTVIGLAASAFDNAAAALEAGASVTLIGRAPALATAQQDEADGLSRLHPRLCRAARCRQARVPGSRGSAAYRPAAEFGPAHLLGPEG